MGSDAHRFGGKTESSRLITCRGPPPKVTTQPVILALLFLLGLSLTLLAVSILSAIGWKQKSDRATENANYNAGLWAEAEAKNLELLVEAARLSGSLVAHERHSTVIERIAVQAIRTSAEREGLDPEEVDEILTGDKILEAEDIG